MSLFTLHPHFRIFGKDFPAFQVMGVAGFLSAWLVCSFLGWYVGMPLWIPSILLLVSMGGFLGLTWLEKQLKRKEDIVYYHHLLLFLLESAALLTLVEFPILKGCDVFLTGFAICTVFGRVGCFHAGCCHGKPHRHGIAYPGTYRAVGFARHLLGVPLWTTQLLESAGAFILFGIQVVLVLLNIQPGTAGLFFLGGYALLRFLIEFLRGDLGRPYWLAFSEAQWTSLGILVAAFTFALSIVHPIWPLLIIQLAAVVVVAIAFRMQLGRIPAVIQPMHFPAGLNEFSKAAEASFDFNRHLVPDSSEQRVCKTSWGLWLSCYPVSLQDKPGTGYTLSSPNLQLSQNVAGSIAETLLQMRHSDQQCTVQTGANGIWHILFIRDDLPPSQTRP